MGGEQLVSMWPRAPDQAPLSTLGAPHQARGVEAEMAHEVLPGEVSGSSLSIPIETSTPLRVLSTS